ncbi:PilN domain-containing protein [Clostridium kluyveri]|uniref:PilN domain-containing protein n=1 Tax=Clostridium kluyveri TaxID=1534 RepID=UPI002247A67D|nr:PilN domain-containing protein [Clostridium kluyveri]UZQ50789.1 PilN domain-containing protein [Clostridium kluyveri]
MKKSEIFHKIKKLSSIKLKDIKLRNIKFIKTKSKKTHSIKQDFNFFQPYLGKHKQQRNYILYGTLTITTVMVIFIAAFIWNLYRINVTKNEINSINSALQSPQTKNKLAQLDKLNKKYNIMDKYYKQAFVINHAIENRNVVGSVLIGKISSAIPRNISFKSLDIETSSDSSKSSIDINGTSDSRDSVAELQHNLKLLDEIKEVQVLNINEENSDINSENTSEYTFSIKCTLKDADENEAK